MVNMREEARQQTRLRVEAQSPASARRTHRLQAYAARRAAQLAPRRLQAGLENVDPDMEAEVLDLADCSQRMSTNTPLCSSIPLEVWDCNSNI